LFSSLKIARHIFHHSRVLHKCAFFMDVLARDALELFDNMRKGNIKASGITFVALLSVCSNTAGFGVSGTLCLIL
jgi:hypothetical protein